MKSRFHPFRRRGAALPLAMVLCLSAPSLAGAAAPTIRLFPTSVLEEIKHTGSVAKEMESGLQPLIQRLDQQQQLYLESKCEGSEDDPGCERIARQLGATYLEMLNVMNDKLPAMEQAVEHTRASLEKRLRKELGMKKTPWELQELLTGKASTAGADPKPMLRGRSGMHLSQRFQQYYRLVAGAGRHADASLTVVAADIYLDMRDASELIVRTQEEIGRATLMEQLNQSFGSITPEMQEVVAGVKAILFGDEGQLSPQESAPIRTSGADYVSPLQL